ncbi:hypothetical protein FRB99_007672, partial [Tulasnella sp. 403]
MSELTLWCCGERDPSVVFPVTVPVSATVYDLLVAVNKTGNMYTPRIVDLCAWKFEPPIYVQDEAYQNTEFKRKLATAPCVQLCPMTLLSKHFTQGKQESWCISVLVTRSPDRRTSVLASDQLKRAAPSATESDIQRNKARRRLEAREKEMGYAKKWDAPSSASQLEYFVDRQNESHAILNGRPHDARGLPVGLYAAVFDEFTAT